VRIVGFSCPLYSEFATSAHVSENLPISKNESS
jgi:hypothetical protein